LLDRVRQRERDASDADAAVVRMQLAEKTGTIGWHRIDAVGDVDRVLQRATALVQHRLH
jgi:predicted kinase